MTVPGMVSVTFRQLSVPEVVELAADAGLAAIEWGGDVHVPVGDHAAATRARELCERRGRTIASYGSYYRAGEHDPTDFDAVVATAGELGAPSIRVWAGVHGSAEAGPVRRAGTVDALRRAVDSAADHGIGVALEFHPGTLTDTVESTLDLLGAVDGLRTYWQPGRGTDFDGSAVEQVRALLPYLSTAHVFTWSAAGERLELAAGAELWRPVLAMAPPYALLEFVAGDAPDAFRRDAATLLAWLAGRAAD